MEILEPSTDNDSANRRNLYIPEEKERKKKGYVAGYEETHR
jgi:hypothetical protein